MKRIKKINAVQGIDLLTPGSELWIHTCMSWFRTVTVIHGKFRWKSCQFCGPSLARLNGEHDFIDRLMVLSPTSYTKWRDRREREREYVTAAHGKKPFICLYTCFGLYHKVRNFWRTCKYVRVVCSSDIWCAELDALYIHCESVGLLVSFHQCSIHTV